MFLIRVRNDYWWIYNIKKRLHLVKTIRLSTNNEIFGEKNSKFFMGWGSSRFFNWWHKITWKNHFWHLFSPKMLHLVEKYPILGTLLILKTYFIPTTEFVLSRRLVQAPILPYFERWFFDQKKRENWSKLKNFVEVVLITHF